MVLELKDPLGEGEAAVLLGSEDVWCIQKGEARVRSTPCTLNPKPSTFNPEPRTLNPKP